MNEQQTMALAIVTGQRLVAEGADAVVLMGSQARGDALPHSDIDVLAIGAGPAYRLELCEGRLVAITWQSINAIMNGMADPASAGSVVQGWRDGRILVDPAGMAKRFKERAVTWDWSVVGDARCDSYVADELTGLAEEVHKLVNLLASMNLRGAAVQRSILSYRLGAIMAVHLRLLYSSENELWNLVAGLLGAAWKRSQDQAFGLGGEPFEMTCEAALDLYVQAAELLDPLFDARQRAVVTAACSLRSAM